MKLRPLIETDIIELDKLWQEHWSNTTLPNRRDKVVDAVVDNEEGRLIGYGQVKMFAEAMLFIDPTARKRDRARATKLLMSEALRGAKAIKVQDLYAFIKDPDFSLFIQHRYDFHAVPEPGELLLRSL